MEVHYSKERCDAPNNVRLTIKNKVCTGIGVEKGCFGDGRAEGKQC